MNQQELEKLISILGNQIESKNTVERITNRSVKQDGKLIEVKKTSKLKDGGVVDNTSFNIPILDCGCLSRGR